MKKETQAKAEILRQKSSDLLEKKSKKAATKLEGEFQKLIHELQVHQVELELQNEELMRANENAEIATEKYTELYDFAPTGYFTLSKDGEIKELNITGAKMLGKNRSELKNRMFGLYVSTGTKPAFNLFIAGIFTNMEQSNCEVTLTKNGTSLIDVNLTGIVTKEGDICFVTAVDVTERNRKENLLRQSESRLAEIQIIANLGTYSFDIVADKWESSGMLDTIFGINPDFDKSFSGWTSIIHPDWQQEMTDYFNEEVIGKKIKFDKEYKIIRQNDKAECWVHGTGRLIFNDKNQPLIMLGSIRDITHSKQREEDINVKNAELLKLNAEKDKFFSIIAHDLKGPFNGFVGLNKIMAEQLPSLDIEEIQKMAETMLRSANNLYKLLENLLQWSQMEQGLISYNPIAIPLLSSIVENLTTELDVAKNKGIDFDFDIPDNMAINADVKMFRSIICNLFANAVKFTPEGGKIIISAKQLDYHSITISVQDSGIGMNSEIISKLFHLTEQINRRGTTGEHSTGLGLFLCKDFIEKHGGTIKAVSEEGKGSTFQFNMPCNG
jgi:PAS domain S-box-containing protein